MHSWWMLAGLVACTGSGQADYVARDPCSALAIASSAASPAQRDGIAGALALWRGRGVAAFDVAAGAAPAIAATVEIRFDDAGDAFHGVYDPTDDRVVINRAIADPATLAIVIAHEFGHVFGLVHIAPASRVSLMNPGNLVTPPSEGDQRALEALWGACN